MKTALILHGWEGTSKANWFPWLKQKLEQKAFEVYIPNLPTTNSPNIEEQEEYINIYSSDFKDGGYIIGHSLGCQLALKFIEENNIKNVEVILVAPSYPNLAKELGEDKLQENYQSLKKYYDTELDFKKINGLNNKYTVFLSDDDPFINMKNTKKYYKNLENIQFVDFENKGHFSESSQIFELEEILNYIDLEIKF